MNQIKRELVHELCGFHTKFGYNVLVIILKFSGHVAFGRRSLSYYYKFDVDYSSDRERRFRKRSDDSTKQMYKENKTT